MEVRSIDAAADDQGVGETELVDNVTLDVVGGSGGDGDNGDFGEVFLEKAGRGGGRGGGREGGSGGRVM